MHKLILYMSKNKGFSLILAIVWTLIIFVGCSTPGRDLPSVHLFDQFDKVVHFVFFFFFFILWKFNLLRYQAGSVIIIIFAIIYGFGLEWYQLNFVAGRSFDVWDGVADAVGGVAGFIFWIMFKKNGYERV